MAHAGVGDEAQETVDQPEAGAQDRDEHDLVDEPHAFRALQRGLQLVLVRPQPPHRLVGEDHRGVVQRLPEHAVRRRAVAEDRDEPAQQDVVDDGHAIHGAGTY